MMMIAEALQQQQQPITSLRHALTTSSPPIPAVTSCSGVRLSCHGTCMYNNTWDSCYKDDVACSTTALLTEPLPTLASEAALPCMQAPALQLAKAVAHTYAVLKTHTHTSNWLGL
jgi:hypothetical protein